MVRFNIVLAGVLLTGMIALGLFQTYVEVPESTLAGAAILEEPLAQTPQEQVNLCMNGCMRSCVSSVEDNAPCRAVCEKECGVVQ